jgi:hypothetical protein
LEKDLADILFGGDITLNGEESLAGRFFVFDQIHGNDLDATLL